MPLLKRLKAFMRETQAIRSASGPYRYLIRKWDDMADLNLAANVLQTEFFRDELVPVPLPVQDLDSILLLAPHQDDEAIGAGGTLLLASQSNIPIEIVYITDGAVRGHPYLGDPPRSGILRDQEAEAFCRNVQAQMHHLRISNILPRPTLEHLNQLGNIIKNAKPQVLMLPWLLDSPAKHRMVNHLLWLVSIHVPGLPQFEVWGYQVHNTLLPNGFVDITDVAEQKRELIRYFRSEVEFVQCYDHLALGMNAWNARFLDKSPIPRYVEVFFTLPFRELSYLIRKFYFDDIWRTYRGHSGVVEGMSYLHKLVLSSSTRESV